MKQEKDQSINLGKELLEKGLDQSQLNLPNILKNEQIESIAKDLSFHSVPDLLANIGYGKVSANQVIGRLRPKLGIEEPLPAGIVRKMVSRIKRKRSTHGIKLKVWRICWFVSQTAVTRYRVSMS
jgi:GTP pyrophosphokinase